MSGALRWEPSVSQTNDYAHVSTSLTGSSTLESWGRVVSFDSERLRQRFGELQRAWSKATINMSFIEDMIAEPHYQAIIDLGRNVVPLLLEELKAAKPAHWFYALHKITGADPVEPADRGDLSRMAEAWIKWGKEHKYI